MLPRYKLDAVMEDTTGAMNITIFDKPARKLVGLSAEELVEDTAGEKISAIIGSHQSRAVVVAPHRGGFMVRAVLNDDYELQVSCSVKMEAGGGGGGELSYDEGCSASYRSSHIKNDKVEYDFLFFVLK